MGIVEQRRFMARFGKRGITRVAHRAGVDRRTVKNYLDTGILRSPAQEEAIRREIENLHSEILGQAEVQSLPERTVAFG